MSRRIARRNAKKLLLEQQEEEMRLQEEEDLKPAPTSNKIFNDKKKKPQVRNKIIPATSEFQLPSDDVLQLYSNSFAEMFEDLPLLQERIQAVKQDLYNRDYISAFGSEINRQAYVVRWSPLRSLAYASLFMYLDLIRLLITNSKSTEDINVLSIGGGAGSELVAFASCFAKSRPTSSEKKLNVKLVDIADWGSIVDNITQYINTNWLDQELIFQTDFKMENILEDNQPEITYPSLQLITLLFTTNELFTESKSLAIKLFQNFNTHCTKGCLLLITESAGSYSEIEVGTKKFPIQFLVDMLLCGKPGLNDGKWELVDQNDSIWYRLEEDINYDVKLENMRCFYRLYRKL